MQKINVKEIVREKLDGFDVRQRSRDAARKCANLIRHVYALRRKGYLNQFDTAVQLLIDLGLQVQTQEIYGCRLLSCAVGITLCYGPDQKLSWAASPRITRDHMPETECLFTDEPEPAFSLASLRA